LHYSQPTGGSRILVINSEPAVCDALAAALRCALGAEVDLALTGQRGGAMITNGGLDLAIIDCALTDISGFELARLAADQNIPVILISGDAEISLKLQQFGYEFLVKPFTAAMLISISSQVICKRQENVRRVKAAATKMVAHTETLRATSAASRQLLDESEAKWLSRGIILRRIMYHYW
jgi:DNA-binding NtrC family response regulator